MLSVQFISTKNAINYIVKDYHFIKEHIIDEYELDETGNILYVNDKNLDDNIYTNIYDQSTYKWLGIYDNDILIGLQLIGIYDDYIELIIIEKKKKIMTKESVFGKVIDFVKQTYHKDIITFPKNDRLDEYYKQFGFKDFNNEYIVNRIV